MLGFLILHLVDFTFEARPGFAYEEMEPFAKALAILQNPISAAVYLAGSIILGIHLGHGVRSALQSLGLNHPKYNSCLRGVGVLFAFVVGWGFALFAVWAWFYQAGGAT